MNDSRIKKITYDELVEMVKELKDDPLAQIQITLYEVDGYVVRLNGEFVQWRTPLTTNFTLGLSFDEFIKQSEAMV